MYGLRISQAIQDREDEEVLDLITWLPPGSALHSMMEANGVLKKALTLYGWDTGHELSLAIVNLVRHQTYVIQQTQSPKRIPVPPLTPGPRPRKRQVEKGMDADAIARGFLQAAKAADAAKKG